MCLRNTHWITIFNYKLAPLHPLIHIIHIILIFITVIKFIAPEIQVPFSTLKGFTAAQGKKKTTKNNAKTDRACFNKSIVSIGNPEELINLHLYTYRSTVQTTDWATMQPYDTNPNADEPNDKPIAFERSLNQNLE